MEGNGFEWNNGYIKCIYCDTYIKRPVDMKQHVKSARHQKQLKARIKPVEGLKIPDTNDTAYAMI